MKMTLDANAKERKDLPFEEDFPSLKEVVGYCIEGDISFFRDGQIKQHCLDKQRVKEAIEKAIEEAYPDGYDAGDAMSYMGDFIKKELGLE